MSPQVTHDDAKALIHSAMEEYVRETGKYPTRIMIPSRKHSWLYDAIAHEFQFTPDGLSMTLYGMLLYVGNKLRVWHSPTDRKV